MIKNVASNLSLVHGMSVGSQIYENLRARIILGKLEPGSRISEAEISKNMLVSRQPVREAFIKLRSEGLVEIRPQRGTYISKISIAAVGNARFIREAIEADIVKLLVDKSSPKLVTKLRALIKRQQKLNKNDLDEFMNLDEQFHRSMAELAGKNIAWKVIADMKAHFDRVRYLSTTQKPLQRLIDQHEAIVEAIAEKDKTKAEAAIRYHLQEVLRDLPVIVGLQPDIFEDHDTI